MGLGLRKLGLAVLWVREKLGISWLGEEGGSLCWAKLNCRHLGIRPIKAH